MKWHLDFQPPPDAFTIHHQDRVFLAGSCFTEHIGQHLQDHGFKAQQSPGGILFHPLSIANDLQAMLDQSTPEVSHLMERDHLHLSFMHHSSVQAQSQQALLQTIQDLNAERLAFFRNCRVLILSFGTAFYYYHNTLGTVVANCHKPPATAFTKQLATVEQICDRYQTLIPHLRQGNPELRIVFTVSPVKHLRDGLVEHSRSKATLILAVHELCRRFDRCSYFPAFELVNDDLRDYRFYAPDMAHPNQQAIEYVWEKFSSVYFTSATQQLNSEFRKLIKARAHMHKNGAESDPALEAFIRRQTTVIKQLAPEIEF